MTTIISRVLQRFVEVVGNLGYHTYGTFLSCAQKSRAGLTKHMSLNLCYTRLGSCSQHHPVNHQGNCWVSSNNGNLFSAACSQYVSVVEMTIFQAL